MIKPVTESKMERWIEGDDELKELMDELIDLASKNTIKWRHNPEKARKQILNSLIQKQYYKNRLLALRYFDINISSLKLSGDILNGLGGKPRNIRID